MHAFHSPLMQPMLAAFADAAEGVPAAAPRIPFHSTVHGAPLPAGAAPDAAYWTAQITATVRFADAVGSLCADPPTHLVEIGPGPVLAPVLGRIGAARGLPVLSPPAAAPTPARGTSPSWWPGSTRTASTRAGSGCTRPPTGAPYGWHRTSSPPGGAPGGSRPRPLRRYRTPTTPSPPSPPTTADHAGPGPGPYPDDGTGPRTATGTSTGTATGPGPHGTPGQPSGPEPSGAAAAPPDFGAGVRAVVAEITGSAPEELGEDVRFHDDLGFDSVMLMELKYRLEMRFPELGELSLPEMIAGLVSIGSLAAYLRGLPAPAAV